MNALQRHPWVVMCYFGVIVGFWVMLWAGLEGWRPAFGVAAFGFAVSAVSVCLWVQMAGELPEFSDYLTLVKTLRKLVVQTARGLRRRQ